jgi:hypothetical protein
MSPLSEWARPLCGGARRGSARKGRHLTEETHRIGGESTNQAVRPDEHPWIEEFGATAGDRVLRQGSRSYYRTYLPLTPKPAIRKSCYPTVQDLDARIRRCNVSRCGNGPTGD